MNRESAVKTPAQNDAVESSTNSPAPRGIDWINLMLISEHPQSEARGPARGEQPRWIFRIELDTELDAAFAQTLRALLRDGHVEEARTELLDKTRKTKAITKFVTAAFEDAASAEDAGSSSSQTAADPKAVLQVIEDFAKNARNKPSARAQVDVPLQGWTSAQLDDLRAKATAVPESARNDLDSAIAGARPKHVVTATLHDCEE